LLLSCTCPDYFRRQPKEYKHLWSVDGFFTTLWLNQRNIPEAQVDAMPCNSNFDNDVDNNNMQSEFGYYLPQTLIARMEDTLRMAHVMQVANEDDERAELASLLARLKVSVKTLKDPRDLGKIIERPCEGDQLGCLRFGK